MIEKLFELEAEDLKDLTVEEVKDLEERKTLEPGWGRAELRKCQSGIIVFIVESYYQVSFGCKTVREAYDRLVLEGTGDIRDSMDF